MKSYKRQLQVFLFLVVLHQFYISRYHLLQLSRTSFNIIWENIIIKIIIINRHCPFLTNSQKSATSLTTKIRYTWLRFFVDVTLNFLSILPQNNFFCLLPWFSKETSSAKIDGILFKILTCVRAEDFIEKGRLT